MNEDEAISIAWRQRVKDAANGLLTSADAENGRDFTAGWRAGVEWAEDHGESSMIKWFVDCQREAEQSYVDAGLPIPKHPLARTEPDVGDSGQLND